MGVGCGGRWDVVAGAMECGRWRWGVVADVVEYGVVVGGSGAVVRCVEW